MSMKTLSVAAAVAALFALPLAGHAQQSAGTLMKDSAITTKIKAAQAADPTVRATSIDVETDNNGVVKLSGTARSQAEIDRAVELARGVEGVTSVTNNMRLAATGSTGSGSTATTTTTTTPSPSAAPSTSTTTTPSPSAAPSTSTSDTMRPARSDRG